MRSTATVSPAQTFWTCSSFSRCVFFLFIFFTWWNLSVKVRVRLERSVLMLPKIRRAIVSPSFEANKTLNCERTVKIRGFFCVTVSEPQNGRPEKSSDLNKLLWDTLKRSPVIQCPFRLPYGLLLLVCFWKKSGTKYRRTVRITVRLQVRVFFFLIKLAWIRCSHADAV